MNIKKKKPNRKKVQNMKLIWKDLRKKRYMKSKWRIHQLERRDQ